MQLLELHGCKAPYLKALKRVWLHFQGILSSLQVTPFQYYLFSKCAISNRHSCTHLWKKKIKTRNYTKLNKIILKDFAIVCSWNLKVGGAKIEKAPKVMATSWNLKLKCGPDFLRAFFSNRKPLSVRRSKVFIGGAALLRCDRFKESLTELRRVSLFLIGVISSTPISNIVNLIRLVRATRAWGVCASQQRPKNK